MQHFVLYEFSERRILGERDCLRVRQRAQAQYSPIFLSSQHCRSRKRRLRPFGDLAQAAICAAHKPPRALRHRRETYKQKKIAGQ